jgi:hypothetical protein
MSYNAVFETAFQLLLAKEVICEHRYPEEHLLLQADENINRMNIILGMLNRQVKTTQDKSSYLLAYVDPTKGKTKDAVKAEFSLVVNQIEPLVKWLRLVMDVSGSERPIVPGDLVSESEMQSRIEQVPTLESKLDDLVRTGLFVTRQSESKGRLASVMGKLVDEGYLTRIGTAGSRYRATGKFSWLYDVMEFVKTHENLPEPEMTLDDEQIGLLE